MTIPLTQSTDGLPNTLYDTVLEDNIDGDFFFDALEDVDPSLDAYVDVGDYAFSIKDPYTPFSFPGEGTADNHGERIYEHISGANVKVFVSKSEDDGSLPSDHTFWRSYFSNETSLGKSKKGWLILVLGTKSTMLI